MRSLPRGWGATNLPRWSYPSHANSCERGEGGRPKAGRVGVVMQTRMPANRLVHSPFARLYYLGESDGRGDHVSDRKADGKLAASALD